MKIIPQTTLLPAGQDPDTLSVSNVVPVVVPSGQKLQLKMEKPAIKTFDFERQDSMTKKIQATVVAPSPAKVAQEYIPAEAPARIPDIDLYWQSFYSDLSPLTGAFYPSMPSDGVSVLTYGNYYGQSDFENAGRELSSVSGLTDSIGVGKKMTQPASTDTLALGKKTVQWVENIVEDRPQVVQVADTANSVLHQEWFFSIVILSVVIIGLLRLKWSKYLGWVFNSVLFLGMATTLKAERTGVSRAVPVWLGFLFYLNTSLFVFEVFTIHHRTLMGLSGWRLLMIIMAFLVVLFTAKMLTYKFVGWVFGVGEAVRGYLFQSTLMSKAYAMVLLPVVVLFPFANEGLQQWLFGTGVGVFILLYLMQIGRGIVINLREPVSGYYIILYLCGLEILPLSILYRVLLY